MQNILIIGAGEAGRIIAHELKKKKDVHIVGFLDDNAKLFGKIFYRISVLGKISALSKISKKASITEIIIAIPSVKGEVLKPIIERIKKVGLPYRITPGYYNCESDNVDIKYPLRAINITDLLGRHTVNLPLPAISAFIKGKRVLITGAGGSIGSEISRISAMFHPKELILLGRGEGSIFAIQNELDTRFPKIKTKPLIVNCTDRSAVMEKIKKAKPQIIFHAAAHKHVHFMEKDPSEAFKNNVLGSINVFDAAVECKAENVVFISTDKAVKPKSVMGMTKRVSELLIKNDYIDKGPIFCGVRFGNVLGSRGSVVEVFNNQIEAGGPVTLTDKKAKRYFMTIPEAAQLVLIAGAISKRGHIYVLDTGAEMSIYKLAKDLISLHGYIPDKDIKIKVCGLRPGEKLNESPLVLKHHQKTVHPKIFDESPFGKSKKIKSKLMKLKFNIAKSDIRKCCI